MQAKKKHAPWLDWLRFGAAFAVLFGHARQFTFVDYGSLDPSYKTLPMAAFLFLGRVAGEAVIVFFVISGYLVGGSALSRARAGMFDATSYTIDRIARIGTPLIPAIILTIAIGYIIGGEAKWLIGLANALSLQGIFVGPLWPNDPLWSLSYEVWFYVFGGGVAALIIRHHWAALAVVLLSLSVYLKLDISYLGMWLIGTATYYYRPMFPKAETFIACIIAGAGVVLSQLSIESQSLQALPINHTAALFVLSIGVAWLVACVSELKCPERLQFAGTAAAAPSYTLYLSHAPLLALFAYSGLEPSQPTGSTWLAFAGLIAFCLAFSVASYFVFERNTWRVRRWLHSVAARSLPDRLPSNG